MDNLESFVFIDTSEPLATYLAQEISKHNYRVIAFFGPSGGGKTTFAKQVQKVLKPEKAALLFVDDYWYYSRAEMDKRGLTGYEWECHDKERFLQDLSQLKQGKAIDKPIQDYELEKRSNKTEHVEPRDIILLDGIVDFTDIADLLIFVYASDETLLKRRMKRDTYIKSFKDTGSLENYIKNKSLPAYKKALLPLLKHTNFVINTEEDTLHRKKED